MSCPALVAAVLALAFIAGCGGDSPSSAPSRSTAPLTAGERTSADRSVAAIRTYCRRLARSLGGVGPRPEVGDAVAGAGRIAALARRKPAATYRGSQTARDLAADLAEDLEGTNCSARLVTELARGL